MMHGKQFSYLLQDEVANTSSEGNNHGVDLDGRSSTLKLSRLAGRWRTNSRSGSSRRNTGSTVASVVAGDDGGVGSRDGAGAVGGGVTGSGCGAGHGDSVDAVDSGGDVDSGVVSLLLSEGDGAEEREDGSEDLAEGAHFGGCWLVGWLVVKEGVGS